jgi:hypothetical protein
VSSRWDYLYDLKPVPLEEHLLSEAARDLAERLLAWPPEILEWSSASDCQRFGHLVAPGSPRPSALVFREAFRLARWELAREYEEIDSYMRREAWAEVIPRDGYDALVFLYKYLTEEMLALSDATEGRIGRKALSSCLSETERRMAERTLIVL